MLVQEAGAASSGDAIYHLIGAIVNVLTVVILVWSFIRSGRVQARQDDRWHQQSKQDAARWQEQGLQEDERERNRISQLKRERLVANYPKWATACAAYEVHRTAFLFNRGKAEELHAAAGHSKEAWQDPFIVQLQQKIETHKHAEFEAYRVMKACSFAIRLDDGAAFAAKVDDLTRKLGDWGMLTDPSGGPDHVAEAYVIVEERIESLALSKR